jgi:hypothetical protein
MIKANNFTGLIATVTPHINHQFNQNLKTSHYINAQVAFIFFQPVADLPQEKQ